MQKLTSVKRLVICALCTALCYVLPLAFHALTLGNALSPLHIPVLLCGLVCGPAYGVFCGIVGPVLSSVLSGMPPATGLISMVPELAVYGLVCGLLMKWVRTGKVLPDLYISMVPAMLAGRIVGGIAKALFLLGTGGSYSLAMFVSSYFVGSVPGIILHLILVPAVALTLEKARAIPARYVKVNRE